MKHSQFFYVNKATGRICHFAEHYYGVKKQGTQLITSNAP
jgi:competence transcription factor ComK